MFFSNILCLPSMQKMQETNIGVGRRNNITEPLLEYSCL